LNCSEQWEQNRLSNEKPPPSLVLNKELLKQFINGQLEPEVEERVAAQLESRPELLAKVAAVSGDGFVQRLRDAKQRSISGVSLNQPPEKQPSHTIGVVPAVASTPTPAKIEFPGYELIKELGRGGMGVVYLAKNIEMDRLEVLKVLSDRLLNHAGAEQRFRQEIRAVSKLNHPNIVTSYNFLRTPTNIAFAMEYVQGSDLHKYIQKQKQLPIGLACSLARQIAAGLQHAHEKGLVHRDIKPSNAMLYKSDGKLQLKILDFGLAKATSEKGDTKDLTQDGTMLGTPEYMAPEQMLNAAKADIRADIYSLGCTLYHMLAGHAPFTGTQGQIMMAHAQNEATPVNLIRIDVSIELAAMIAKMMAKEPDKRFQTPSQVNAALQPFLSNSFGLFEPQTYKSTPAENTVDETNQSERDTSVEIINPKPIAAQAIEQSPISNPALSLLGNPAIGIQTKPKPRAKPRNSKSQRNQFLIQTSVPIMAGLFVISFGLWISGVFTFKTPDGTIIVEQMPPEAEVFVDGKQMEIVWNEGKDKAQVTVDPGNHQLKVINQGNEMYGKAVTIKSGDQSVVKLASTKPTDSTSTITMPAFETEPKLSEFELLPPKQIFEAAYAIANRELLESFHTQIDLLSSKQDQDDNVNQALLDAIKHELLVFETYKTIPFSPTMRTAAMAYLKKLAEATKIAAEAYDLQIKKASSDTELSGEASKLMEEKNSVLKRRLIGQWRHPKGNANVYLYSNGELERERGILPGTWSLDAYHLIFDGGTYIDTNVIDASGTKFSGSNRQGGKFPGELVESSRELRAQDGNESELESNLLGQAVSGEKNDDSNTMSVLLPKSLPDVKQEEKGSEVANETAKVFNQEAPLPDVIKNREFAEGLKNWKESGETKHFLVFSNGPAKRSALTTASNPGLFSKVGRISQSFVVPSNAVTFECYLHGSSSSSTYVAIKDKENNKTIWKQSGPNQQQCVRYSCDLRKLQGKPVTLEIVDENRGNYGYIGIEGIQIYGEEILKLVPLQSEDYSTDGPARKINEMYVKDGTAGIRSNDGWWGWNFASLKTNQLFKAKVRVRNQSNGMVGFCFNHDPVGVAVWLHGDQAVSFGHSLFSKEKPKELQRKFSLPNVVKRLEEWNELACILKEESLVVFVNDIYVGEIDLKPYPISNSGLSFSMSSFAPDTVVEMTEYEIFAIEDSQ
jgi:serine/threonine protein kinase